MRLRPVEQSVPTERKGDRREAAARSIRQFVRAAGRRRRARSSTPSRRASARRAASWSTACGSSATARSTCASSARGTGSREALISGDADWFLQSLTYIKEGSVPLKHSTKVAEGCPKDCGLCPDHEQHSCLPIIEITNHCNLECPICIVQNRHNYHMTAEEFARDHRRPRSRRKGCSTRSTSPAASRRCTREFLEFLDMARAAGDLRASRSRPTACASPPTTTSAEELARAQGLRQPAARRAEQPRAARPARRRRSPRGQGARARQPGARRRAHDDRLDRRQGRQRRSDRRLRPPAVRARLHPVADVPAGGVHRLRRRALRAARSARRHHHPRRRPRRRGADRRAARRRATSCRCPARIPAASA